MDLFNKYLSDAGLSPETCKTYMVYLKAIVNKAASEGITIYRVNPFINTKFKPFRNKKPRTVEKMFLKELREQNLKPKQEEVRNMFLFQLMSGGMRVGDLLMLRWNNFVFTQSGVYLNYRQEKSRHEMTAKVPLVALRNLNHLLISDFPDEVASLDNDLQRLERLQQNLKSIQESLYVDDPGGQSEEDVIHFDEQDFLDQSNQKQATVAYLTIEVKRLQESILKVYMKLIRQKQLQPSETVFGFLKGSDIHRSGVVTKKSLKKISNATKKYNYHLNRICEIMGYPKITTHQARHTYAQFLSDNNLNVYHISQALGHSSIQITQNYLREMNTSTLDTMNDRLGDII